jgi:hypothetical protein
VKSNGSYGGMGWRGNNRGGDDLTVDQENAAVRGAALSDPLDGVVGSSSRRSTELLDLISEEALLPEIHRSPYECINDLLILVFIR